MYVHMYVRTSFTLILSSHYLIYIARGTFISDISAPRLSVRHYWRQLKAVETSELTTAVTNRNEQVLIAKFH